jgi:uncharacterized membrane protein YdjX (TVP38/TMEM64 family)
VVLVWWVGRSLSPGLLRIVAHIQNVGPAAPAAFIAIYALAVVALIPASLLTIAGGAVFGLLPGMIYALVGATLGSTGAFLIGRHAARRLVARRLAAMPRFVAIERAVFLLRLSPVVPFNFLNYALGLTTISVWDFVFASLGTVPGAFVYSYAGKVTGEALALAGKAEIPKNASYYAVLLAGLVATIAATTVVTRTARRALQDV